MHPAAVIIIGTSHSIQMASSKLKTHLERLCRELTVRAVAEEMSEEALLENNYTASVPMRVAEALRLPHRFCDPDRAERTRLQIRQENEIRKSAFLANLPEPEVLARLSESHAKRELYWLRQLRNHNLWPVLFVCGANHVRSFGELLRREGIVMRVVAEDWVIE